MQREVREAVRATAPVSPSQEVEQLAEKYLTFRLGSEAYVVPFTRVREIMGLQEIRALAGAPVFVKGVIKVRGKILPVVDLRLKFGFLERDYKRRNCVIVAQIENDTAGKLTMGIVVDSVAQVLMLNANDFHDGSIKLKGKINFLLDLDVLLSRDEMDRLIAACY
jgi:purine-binding chemotaxis protein CheW